ncbi:MAG: hypothetical protein ACYCST_09570 [Acidimicrobiales bacterium]
MREKFFFTMVAALADIPRARNGGTLSRAPAGGHIGGCVGRSRTETGRRRRIMGWYGEQVGDAERKAEAMDEILEAEFRVYVQAATPRPWCGLSTTTFTQLKCR